MAGMTPTDWKSVAQTAIARGLFRVEPPKCQSDDRARIADLDRRAARRRTNQALGLRYDGKPRIRRRFGIRSYDRADYMRQWRRLQSA